MWIRKAAFEEWVRSVRALEEYSASLQRHSVEQARQLAEQGRELTVVRASEADARVKLAAANAYADSWRLQINELRQQNAALLAKLLPDLKISVPMVEHAPMTMPAGLDFDDMGDAAAQMMGYADEHPVTGASVGTPRTVPVPPVAPAPPTVPYTETRMSDPSRPTPGEPPVDEFSPFADTN
jgi:hypothetical protein